MSSEKELYEPLGRNKVEIVKEQADSAKNEIAKTLQDLANRGKKLEELEEQTAMLSSSAGAFKEQSSTVRKGMWWKNAKMTVILTVTIILILAAIIIPTVLKLQGKI